MTKHEGDDRIPDWSLRDWVYQYAAATAYGVRPNRLKGLPGLTRSVAANLMLPAEMRPIVPDPRCTLAALEGYAGVCRSVEPDTLMAGLRAGIYQNAHAWPYKWWSPVNRMVLFFDELHLEKNLKRKLRQGRYTVTFDQDFEAVMHHCAGPRRQRKVQLTWLTPPVMRSYLEMFRQGQAHSVEIRNDEGDLTGGLFGIGSGRLFVTKSQFALERDMSKIAFAVLNRHLQAWGYVLNDVLSWSAHLERLGCQPIPREDFLAIVGTFARDQMLQPDWQPVEKLCSGDFDPAAEAGWTRDKVYEAANRKLGQDVSDFAADADSDKNGRPGDTVPTAA